MILWRCVAAPLVLPAVPMTLALLEQYKELPVIVESAIRVRRICVFQFSRELCM